MPTGRSAVFRCFETVSQAAATDIITKNTFIFLSSFHKNNPPDSANRFLIQLESALLQE